MTVQKKIEGARSNIRSLEKKVVLVSGQNKGVLALILIDLANEFEYFQANLEKCQIRSQISPKKRSNNKSGYFGLWILELCLPSELK